jgi:hypothetical protein
MARTKTVRLLLAAAAAATLLIAPRETFAQG